MDKFHIVLAKLHVVALYPIMGVPLWILAVIGSFPVIDQLVKRAGWTTARSFVELAARFFLKSPLIGPSLALIPLLGDILHKVANDVDVPPTLAMRIKGSVPPKDPPSDDKPSDKPSDKPPGASGTVPVVPPAAVLFLLVFVSILVACATMKHALIDFGKCELGQVPSVVSGLLPDVDKVLASEDINWEDQLAGIGRKAGADAVICAVKSIVGAIEGKHAALDATGRRKLDRGQIYLNKHPAGSVLADGGVR